MERRFAAGMLGALALHAALLLAAFTPKGAIAPTPVPSSNTPAIEVAVLVDDGSGEADTHLGSSAAEPSPTSSKANRSANLSRSAHSAGTEAPVAGAEFEVVASDVAEAPREQPRRIDLGLDGSIMRSAVLDASRRPTSGRKVAVLDGWSESAVRLNAELSAPREGSALLTIEWDAQGRLQSIATSGHSSEQKEWRKLADSLRPVLSQHPRRPDQARGLRLVYVVRSEIVKALSERSQLPRSEYASVEQIRDELLPPANTINLGVRADTSTPGERVVSVTLASSQVL